ncbi:hypothetical protein [Acinetobacter proteolyticus]|uniref:hypothetical protein n=1 Tax=Acinetobacter proteolyticus TaxID=1776741 RepID=UPI003D98C45D
MNKKFKLFSSFIGFICILYGCNNPNQETKSSQSTVIIPQIKSSGEGDNASYSEATIKIEGSCLYFENRENRILPIFATQEAYWDSKKNVLVVDEKESKNGEVIAYGSGEPYPIDLNTNKWIIKPANSCSLKKGIIINKLIQPLIK